MIFSNKVYDILKWIAQILLPALITLFGTIATALGFEHTDVVITIAVAVDTFLGTLLGISSNAYNARKTNKEVEANENHD
jgi:hypothetical protein